MHVRLQPVLRWLATWLLPLALMACGGQGCSGCSAQTTPPQVSPALLLPASVQARVTQHGFDVIAGQIQAVLALVLGGGKAQPGGVATLDVSKLLGVKALSFSGGFGLFQGKATARDLVLTLDLQGLDVILVDPSSPAKLRVVLDHAQLSVVKGIVTGEANVAGVTSDAACHLLNGVGVGGKTPHLATLSATLDVVLAVDAAGKLQVQTAVSKPVLHDVGFGLAKDCGLAECTDKFLLEPACLECEVCATGKLASDAVATLKAALEPILGQLLEVVGNALVQQVLAKNLNGKPLDIEVPVDVRAILQQASPALAGVLGPAAPLRARVRPSPQAFRVLQGGLETRLDAGLWAPADGCVANPGANDTGAFAQLPQGPPPPIPLQMVQLLPDGQSKPRTVDVAVVVARNLVEEGVWSLTRSGLLCAGADSAQVYQLSGGKLVLSAGVLDLVLPGARELAGRSGAPLRLATMPSADPDDAPVVTLGQDAQGRTEIQAKIKHFEVRLELLVRGRWLTVLEADADLLARVALRVVGGQLQLIVSGVDVPAVQVAQGGLFPHAQVGALAPAVVQVAVALLLAKPIEIEMDVQALLTQALALPLTAEVIGVEAGGAAHDWLVLGLALQAGGPP